MPSRRMSTTSPSKVTGGGPTTTIDPFVDTFTLDIQAAESNAAPTDADTYQIALAQSDTMAGQVETVTLEFPTGVWGESNSTPTEANNFAMRVWLSGSAGSGVDNPTNANSENNGTVATVETALLGSASETLTSEVGVNIPAGVSVASAIYRGWFTATLPLGTSSAELIAHSSTALFTDVVMNNVAGNWLDGSFTFDLVAAGIDTAAKLGSLQIYHRTTDLVAGVTPATMTVDAGAVELAAAFS